MNNYKDLDINRIIVFGHKEKLNNILKSIKQLYLDTHIEVECNILNEAISYYVGTFSNITGIYKYNKLESSLNLIEKM